MHIIYQNTTLYTSKLCNWIHFSIKLINSWKTHSQKNVSLCLNCCIICVGFLWMGITHIMRKCNMILFSSNLFYYFIRQRTTLHCIGLFNRSHRTIVCDSVSNFLFNAFRCFCICEWFFFQCLWKSKRMQWIAHSSCNRFESGKKK